MNELPNKFIKKVLITESCWIWTARINKGYGQYQENGRPIAAHRYSWTHFYGEIPDGIFVCHKCNNPKCVNPKHLFLGTHKENMLDMIRKGRGKNNFSLIPKRGEEHPRAKLTDEDIVTIRRIYKPRTQGNYSQNGIAKMYGVDKTTIRDIISGKRWGHIKSERDRRMTHG